VSSATLPQAPRLRGARRLLTQLVGSRTAVLGAAGIVGLVLAASFGSLLWPWQPDQIDPQAFLSPPSWVHPLGTTQTGRDLLALTLRGLGRSMLIGMVAAGLSTSMAAIVGASAAYLGGRYEKAMLVIIDLLLVVPSFFLIAVVSQRLPGTGGSWLILALLLAAFAWPFSARVVRSLTLTLREREYVLAARFIGLTPWRIIWRHILPNAASLLIIDATLGVGYAILSEAGLAFFGFGVHSPDTSLGTLLAEGSAMATTFPWLFLGPAAVLVVLVVCVNAVGDGLRDALDPGSVVGSRP
jgi:peptide/nickel transport system permease protein